MIKIVNPNELEDDMIPFVKAEELRRERGVTFTIQNAPALRDTKHGKRWFMTMVAEDSNLVGKQYTLSLWNSQLKELCTTVGVNDTDLLKDGQFILNANEHNHLIFAPFVNQVP